MAWNEPNSGGNRPPNSKGGPPDLEKVIRDFLKKINGVLGTPESGTSNGFPFSKIILPLALLFVFIWFVSGLFIVNEAERGVLLRLGKYGKTIDPGLNWKMTFIEKVYLVDVKSIRSLSSSGIMLTKDENIVHVEMNVQYRIYDPEAYLFNLVNPDDSLSQATDSSLRYVVGHTLMNDVLTTGRELVRQQTRVSLENILEPYNSGIELVDVNFLPARPPEEVKDAFDDAIAAQEDEQRFIREAEAYERNKIPKARGQVERLLQDARAYKAEVTLKASGEVARFEKLLPAYLKQPNIVKNRLYLEVLTDIYRKNKKIYIDLPEGNNGVFYLPLDKVFNNQTSKNQAQEIYDSKMPSTDGIDSPQINSNSSQQNSITNGDRSLNTIRDTRADAIQRVLNRSVNGG